MEVDIIIDSLTNCLTFTETGQEYDTLYKKVFKNISKYEAMEYKSKGWKFDWSIPQEEGYEVYQLFLEDDDTVQGMIAVKHLRELLYTHVSVVESAPFNIGSNGKYQGVGAHLFAIACKLSWDAGNEGYVQFTAKTNLVEHYKNSIKAKNIDDNTLYIDSYGAVELMNKYFKESD